MKPWLRGEKLNYHTILWDFDGTLVDTSPGIMACICHACAQLKQPEPEETVLRQFIGPPLYDSFQAYLGYSPPLAEEATRIYRQYYEKDGLYQAHIYPGMKELLEDLCSQGVRHAVTTLKPENTARQLLDYFDIAQYFTVCEGADPSKMKSRTKTQIAADTLKRLGVEDKTQAILIGDTAFDERGARENGIGFVAAAYGFGFSTPPDCLFYAESVGALRDFLL